MMANNDPLWLALQAYPLDAADAELSFTQRLARENAWHPSFAAAVVQEYKKFLWLAMKAGHPVTPSDEVDQAWHLHLVYTESYWDDLCRDILGKPLHHGPTKGGQREDDKYHDWYERTLASYEAAFGTPPPASVWPPSHIRFSRQQRFQRVNTAQHWVISKNRWAPRLRWAACLTAGVGLTAWIGDQLSSSVDAGTVTRHVADGGAVFMIIVVVGLVVWGFKKARGGGGGHGSGCSTAGGCGSSGCSSSHHGHGGSHHGGSDSHSGCSSGSSGCSSGSSGCGGGGGGCGGGGGGD